ncbi:MAG: polymer-forming cytoskeletal protein [Calothrix sp. MO_167.B42]|nr:polymer-forming cytoskeletal protein [Calothrix sp. MO_167.B42]
MRIFKKITKQLKTGALLIFALTLVPLLLIGIPPALSINAIADKQITITADQIIDDDLYLSGETLTIDGTIKGDAVLSGKIITVNGTVDGDLIAAGQTITINGTVKDDVRIAGQVLTIDSKAQIIDDLIAAGASLENKAGSTVGGDVNFAGAQALLAGTVNQSVSGAMNSLELRGAVGQNMQVVAIGEPNPLQIPFIPKAPVPIPEIPEGLTIQDTAKIGGKLTYQSTKEAQVSQQAQIVGGTVREELQYKGERKAGWHGFTPAQTPGGILLQQLQRLVALLLIGWLLLRFVPTWTQGLTATLQAKPMPSLGWGLVTFIGVLAAIIIVPIITFLFSGLLAFVLPSLILPIFGIGILLTACIGIAFAIFATYVPQIIISFLGGQWLMEHLRPNQVTGRMISLFAGLVVLILLTAIPVFGGILELIIVLMGLGVVWLRRKQEIYQKRTMVLQD